MSQMAEMGLESKGLARRFSRLRRRFWLVVSLRGLCWLLTILLATIAVDGLLDWQWHLPGLIRALILVGCLASSGCVFYRYLYLPLAKKVDDLSLALRVEKHYPTLNDSLASAVEFLQEDTPSPASPSLRRRAIHKAIHNIGDCDFNRVIDARGLGMAGLSMTGLTALTLTLALLFPGQAKTALIRLANPFSGQDWPRKTWIDLEGFRAQIGRNETFEIRAWVHGIVPDKAVVAFRFDGGHEEAHSHELTRDDDSPGPGRLVAKLEASRVQRDFSFQVRANDAQTPWTDVAVLPPPGLVSLDGRASPQVHLYYPAYTDLPDQQQADGVGDIEAVFGTGVLLRAKVDRPLSAAWIEYVPQSKNLDLAAFLGILGASNSQEAVTLAAGGRAIFDHVPAQLGPDRRTITVAFHPFVNGLYALHFEDDLKLHSSRVFELKIFPDPAPTLLLQRPSERTDSLSMLPGADLTLKATVDDVIFAVRSVYVEYRCGKGESPRRLPFYDHQITSTVVQIVSGVGVEVSPFFRLTTLADFLEPRLRVKSLEIDQKVSLNQFRRLDGEPLKPGDILTLQLCADDFDDVTFDKQPGRSHEVEIRIVSRGAFDVILNQDQAKIEQSLQRLQGQQREASRKVAEVDKAQRKNGRLTPDQMATLLQAEALQKQIRDNVGQDRKEGLRGDVERIRRTLEDNHLPRSDTDQRMEAVADQLDRLSRDELPAIEPRLTEARKQDEMGQNNLSPLKKENPLTDARQHQDEVEKTLSDLLARLSNWSSTREIKSEAKSILEEQRRLQEETDKLSKDKQFQGMDQNQLQPREQEQLRELDTAQKKLRDRFERLQQNMRSVAAQQADKQTAEDLDQALKQTQDDAVSQSMGDAQREIKENHLAEAGAKQRESIQSLEKLVNTLDDRRTDEQERLVKKLREAEKKLADLEKKQDELRKKLTAAEALADPQQRAEELKRLARQQKELQKETQEMVKELSRLRAGRASQALNQASGHMEQAGERLERGQKEQGEENQDEALDRLAEAREELEKAREIAEEALAREQLAKIADVLKHLKERQEDQIARFKEAQKDLQQLKPDDIEFRVSQGKIINCGKSQRELGKDTEQLASEKLTDAKLLARLLKKAAQAMENAAEHLEKHGSEVSTAEKAETESGRLAAKKQGQALALLNQLLEAMKQEDGVSMRGGAGKGGQGGEGEGEGQGGGAGARDDGIPPLVQLKLLRMMQAEVNARTNEFSKGHPNPGQLTDLEKAQLKDIQRDQQEVADLLDELLNADEPEGDKP